MASEIALANARRKTSANIRRAKRLLESRNHPLFHVSELAAALATVEAFSGDTCHAQQHCHLALADAAENSVAQVGWLQRACGISSGERFLAASQKSNEASAWNASRAKDWPLAFEFALAWQRDQPFSSRPAILAGGIALTISEDFFAAAKILEPATTCNADDATLGNNLAFAYAKMDKVEQAQGVLERLRSTNANIVQSICLSCFT